MYFVRKVFFGKELSLLKSVNFFAMCAYPSVSLMPFNLQIQAFFSKCLAVSDGTAHTLVFEFGIAAVVFARRVFLKRRICWQILEIGNT